MQEISLVRNIFRTLEYEFPADMDRIRGIYLSLGLLNNVQPNLMQNAFQIDLIQVGVGFPMIGEELFKAGVGQGMF